MLSKSEIQFSFNKLQNKNLKTINAEVQKHPM